jgi:hypothetical protein
MPIFNIELGAYVGVLQAENVQEFANLVEILALGTDLI